MYVERTDFIIIEIAWEWTHPNVKGTRVGHGRAGLGRVSPNERVPAGYRRRAVDEDAVCCELDPD